MGKLRALKLGIVKGVQHTIEYGNRQTFQRAVEFTISRLKCIDCNHPSRSHTERRPNFVPMEAEALFKLLKETQDKHTGGMQECIFYFCSDCIRAEAANHTRNLE